MAAGRLGCSGVPVFRCSSLPDFSTRHHVPSFCNRATIVQSSTISGKPTVNRNLSSRAALEHRSQLLWDRIRLFGRIRYVLNVARLPLNLKMILALILYTFLT